LAGDWVWTAPAIAPAAAPGAYLPAEGTSPIRLDQQQPDAQRDYRTDLMEHDRADA
jgi:hypothetical protein